MNKYHATITAIGNDALDLVDNGLCIIFNNNAPPELAELSVMHTIEELKAEVVPGDKVTLAGNTYEVLEVGDEANRTLSELGHCSMRLYDGVAQMKRCLPGYIVLSCKVKPIFAVGQTIEING